MSAGKLGTATATAMAAVLALVGCSSSEMAPPVIRARIGPAADQQVRRVVAMPSTCGTLGFYLVGQGGDAVVHQHVTCDGNAMRAIDQVVRASLELGGFSVIDVEKVNAVTASRREVQERTQYLYSQVNDGVPTVVDGGVTTEITTEQRGARFQDATPAEQLELLAELGAQGVLSTRVSIGAPVGIGQRRLATVQLQLVEMPGRTLVWARRCELEIGGVFVSDEAAMERAARCAVEGIVAR